MVAFTNTLDTAAFSVCCVVRCVCAIFVRILWGFARVCCLGQFRAPLTACWQIISGQLRDNAAPIVAVVVVSVAAAADVDAGRCASYFIGARRFLFFFVLALGKSWRRTLVSSKGCDTHRHTQIHTHIHVQLVSTARSCCCCCSSFCCCCCCLLYNRDRTHPA